MTPHDHDDDQEATASPQALVRDLRAQEGALPEALRRQCLAAGAAMVPALIALLEAGLADDQAEPELGPDAEQHQTRLDVCVVLHDERHAHGDEGSYEPQLHELELRDPCFLDQWIGIVTLDIAVLRV